MIALGVTGALLLSSPSVAKLQAKHPAPATTVSVTPYSMRGVPLGMTLDDFRKFPIPDTDAADAPRTLCSSDKLSSRVSIEQADPEDLARGVITCNWSVKLTPYVERPLTIKLGEGDGTPIFDFIPDGATSRLFQIRFYNDVGSTRPILEGLTARYGPPRQVTTKMRTGAGAAVSADEYTWSNGVSGIKLTSPCRRIDRYCLSYYHYRLFKAYGAISTKRAADAAEKF